MASSGASWPPRVSRSVCSVAPPESDPSRWSVPAGWTLRYQPTTASTNDDAREAARAGRPGRTVFLADGQTAGRGRQGRTWVAPAGTCLVFSLLLRDRLSPAACTALGAVAVVEAIQAETGLRARIKWPNDVMIASRKVCGILTEVVSAQRSAFSAQHSESHQATIVGIGLNVNVDPCLADLPTTATSLAAELGRPWSREAMLNAVLGRINAYLGLGSGSGSVVHARWGELLWRSQQSVRLADGVAVLQGVVEGVAPSGALQLRMGDGSLREIRTGELLID